MQKRAELRYGKQGDISKGRLNSQNPTKKQGDPVEPVQQGHREYRKKIIKT